MRELAAQFFFQRPEVDLDPLAMRRPSRKPSLGVQNRRDMLQPSAALRDVTSGVAVERHNQVKPFVELGPALPAVESEFPNLRTERHLHMGRPTAA